MAVFSYSHYFYYVYAADRFLYLFYKNEEAGNQFSGSGPNVAFCFLILSMLFILLIVFAYVLLGRFFEEQRTDGKLGSENKYFNCIKY